MSAPPPDLSEGTQTRYDVMSPEGGLASLIQEYASEQRHFLDLQISARQGHVKQVRVYPDRQTFRQDRSRDDHWFFYGAHCAELNQGVEAEVLRTCTLRVNTKVTQAGLETGKLTILFKPSEESL